jgi:hypothetical protein
MVKTKNILRNAKQFSIFFLNENCFATNCPNALTTVFCFIKLFSKKNLPNTFLTKKQQKRFFLFLFSKTILKHKNKKSVYQIGIYINYIYSIAWSLLRIYQIGLICQTGPQLVASIMWHLRKNTIETWVHH